MNEISVEKVALILFEKEIIIQNLKEQIVALQKQLENTKSQPTTPPVMAEKGT